MMKLAVISVGLTNTGLETTTADPLTLTVEFDEKPVPVRVTGTVAPWTPLAGAIVVSVGPGGA